MRVGLAWLLVAVALAGCSTTRVQPTVSSAPRPSSTTTTTTVATDAFETTACTSSPSVDFTLLCQAFQLVTETHVDEPDPAALAAAAALGVSQTVPATPEEPRAGPLQCVIPHPSFAAVCEAIVERAGEGPVRDLVEGAVQGIFRYGLDPFSSYVEPDLADRLDALGSGLVLTLGLIVGAVDSTGSPCGPLDEECRLTVLAVFEFAPAANAGVVAGDLIESVNGRPVDGLSADEATALLIGGAGETTEIVLDREIGETVKRLVHEDIRLVPAEFAMATPSIAYLRLNDFSQVAAQLAGRALQQPEVESARGMVLDLRDNPGGLVLAAQAIASQFLHDGDVMVERHRDGRLTIPVVSGGLARPGMDVVILANRGTASAAEVVAAVLQERGRAVVVGERTFGKNLVQEVHTARNGGEIRVSVARWTTPGGLDIGITGLAPDVPVEAMPGAEGDPQLAAALEILRG